VNPFENQNNLNKDPVKEEPKALPKKLVNPFLVANEP
jgi:arylamine N-acetyltransferase